MVESWLQSESLLHPARNKNLDLNDDTIVNLEDFAHCACFWHENLTNIPGLKYSYTSAESSTSNIFWSHRVYAGENKILIVGISAEDTQVSDMQVSQITFAGLPMTAIAGSEAIAGTTDFLKTQLFYLLSPPDGISSIEISFDGAVDRCIAMAASVSGIVQTGPTLVTSAQEGEDNSISVMIQIQVDNSLLIDLVGSGISGQFENQNLSKSFIGFNRSIGDSSAASSFNLIPSARTEQTIWWHNNCGRLALSAVVLEPAE
jgi:hypothetical protein